jgi:hypothetical protein
MGLVLTVAVLLQASMPPVPAKVATEAPATAQPAAKPTIDLRQFTGDWIMEENGRWTRETWGAPTATGIEGTGSSGVGSKTDFTEKLRISKDEKGGYSFFVRLGKSATETAFTLVPSANNSWMFENLKHDYPQRIIYSRDGGWLFSTIMKADGSKSEEFSYRRSNPPRAQRGQPMPTLTQVENAVTFSRRCEDTDGYTNCGFPMRTSVRNLVCWPMDSLAGYREPFRSSPAAECSFESRELRVGKNRKQPAFPWHSDSARFHFIEANGCKGKRCKRFWHIPN